MKAKRRLGQNFLVDRHYQQRIVGALRPSSGETIVEIGPGHGALTRWLVEAGANVIAIEADEDLIPELNETFGSAENFRLVSADALEVDFAQLAGEGKRVRVIGNLPYNISTPILQLLIGSRHCISEVVVMLQREVVERMIAKPGGKEYGYLSVLVQLYCQLEKLFDVPPGAFRPAPRVTSSVCRLRLSFEPRIAVHDENLFLELTQVIFSQRRKTIFNNLRAGRSRLGLSDADIEQGLAGCHLDLRRRAETMSLTEIAGLADCIEALKSGVQT